MPRLQLGMILTIATLLQSCAADYQPAQTYGGFPVSGYTDARIDANTAVVNFDGNRFTSPSTLRAYLLYRCAQVTIENGYDYFIIVSTNTSPTNIQVKTKDTNHYATIPPKVYPVVYRTNEYQSSRATPSAFQCTQGSCSGVSAVIKMFQGQKPAFGRAYDAKDVIAHLGPATF